MAKIQGSKISSESRDSADPFPEIMESSGTLAKLVHAEYIARPPEDAEAKCEVWALSLFELMADQPGLSEAQVLEVFRRIGSRNLLHQSQASVFKINEKILALYDEIDQARCNGNEDCDAGIEEKLNHLQQLQQEQASHIAEAYDMSRVLPPGAGWAALRHADAILTKYADIAATDEPS